MIMIERGYVRETQKKTRKYYACIQLHVVVARYNICVHLCIWIQKSWWLIGGFRFKIGTFYYFIFNFKLMAYIRISSWN